MGNQITSNLPPSLDSFLMDMAQTSEYVDINYTDISKFAEVASTKGINQLRDLRNTYEDSMYDEDESHVRDCGQLIHDLVKGI